MTTKEKMGHLNVEIKAMCNKLETARKTLNYANADFRGLDHQIDVYFRVFAGRLKLRKGKIENCLIHYERENHAEAKQSRVILFQTPVDSAPLEEILTKLFGVLVVVDKKREIYFIDNIKFHLDQVAGLGTFVEIEAIDKDGTLGKERLQQQCQEYKTIFGIRSEDLISCSYSDLLLKN